MSQSITHNEWIIIPPPHTNFQVFEDGNIHLSFERGKEKEVKEWLLKIIDQFDPDYVDPRIQTILKLQAQKKAANLLKEIIAEEEKKPIKIVPQPKLDTVETVFQRFNKPIK